jgi:hypothetical protein
MANIEQRRRSILDVIWLPVALTVLTGCGVFGGPSPSTVSGTAGPADAGKTATSATTSAAPVTSAPTTTTPTTTTTTKATPKKTAKPASLTEGHVFIATPAPGGGPKGLLGVSEDSKITVLGVSTDPSTQWYLKRISSGTFQLMSPVNSEEIDANCLSNDAGGGFSLAVCNTKKAAQAFTFSAQGKNAFTIAAGGGAVAIEDDSIVSGPDRTPTVFTVTRTPEDN